MQMRPAPNPGRGGPECTGKDLKPPQPKRESKFYVFDGTPLPPGPPLSQVFPVFVKEHRKDGARISKDFKPQWDAIREREIPEQAVDVETMVVKEEDPPIGFSSATSPRG